MVSVDSQDSTGSSPLSDPVEKKKGEITKNKMKLYFFCMLFC